MPILMNHLDINAVEWLEAYLRDWSGAVVIVSHDRYFLDQTARVIWEMTPALEVYRGTYRPSAEWPKPHAMVGVNVVAADTDDDIASIGDTTVRQSIYGLYRRFTRYRVCEYRDAHFGTLVEECGTSVSLREGRARNQCHSPVSHLGKMGSEVTESTLSE